jgi:hypothetical protein
MVWAGLAAATIVTSDAVAVPSSPAYRDQLQRCVVALRPKHADPTATAVRHTVADMRLRGVWREFTIDSEILAKTGERLVQASSRCRVHRWGTAIEVQPRS